MTDDLLRATCPPDRLAEFEALVARRKYLAGLTPWYDDYFNEMIAINRKLVALAITPSREEAA